MGKHITVHGADAGLHLLVEDSYGRSQEELIALAQKHNVRIYPTEQYWATSPHPLRSAVLVGFSGITCERIPEGVKRLARAWYGKGSSRTSL